MGKCYIDVGFMGSGSLIIFAWGGGKGQYCRTQCSNTVVLTLLSDTPLCHCRPKAHYAGGDCIQTCTHCLKRRVRD